MSKQQAISVRLDADTLAELDRIAAELDCSRETLVETAVHRLVSEEAPLDDIWRTLPEPPPQPGLEVLDDAAEALRRFIQEGIDAAERGELYSHEEVMAELRRRGRKSAA